MTDLARRSRRRWLRMATLGGASLVVANAVSEEVDWLREVTRFQGNRSGQPSLRPLLKTSDGKPIDSLAAWLPERERLQKAWLEFLGPMPTNRPPVDLEILSEETLPGCTRQLVRYTGEPGQRVEGYLIRPGGRGPHPGVVVLHSTTADTIKQPAGLAGPPEKHLGLLLARRGMVTFSPRCFLWEGGTDLPRAVKRFHQRHPKTLGMHKMLYDAQRGVDVLASLDDVDSRRLGATGHSLGAKETLYLAALDDRIKAAVASEGGVGLGATNWDAPWYLGDAIHQPGFPRDHHELLALVAPRALLIVGGEKGRGAADGDRSWPYVEAALPVYALYGKPARIGLYNHRQGHALPPEAVRRLTQWLEVYLDPSNTT
ncbi:Acetyl xylan esterase (AXE1) [Planctomycetes bacterium Pan216]|uniref:Acetyl xylan esterase (AXE1) n=1 Tax=Kolteria novifilia TaxID=2527975 RepID=A0A518B7N5_9BACT|nr:Acetyl xylan esterase (AXE1) [Planctomycetes bacterium Pan216]